MRAGIRPVYHRVEFHHLDEGAAFIAALSRYLASPMGRIHGRDAHPSEIWAHVGESDGGVVLFLSDGALAATARGFAPPVLRGQARADVVIATCTLVLAAHEASAHGRDEILHRLQNLPRLADIPAPAPGPAERGAAPIAKVDGEV